MHLMAFILLLIHTQENNVINLIKATLNTINVQPTEHSGTVLRTTISHNMYQCKRYNRNMTNMNMVCAGKVHYYIPNSFLKVN